MIESLAKNTFRRFEPSQIRLDLINENSDKLFEWYPKENRTEFNKFHFYSEKFKKLVKKFGIEFTLEYIIRMEIMKQRYGIVGGGLRLKALRKYETISKVSWSFILDLHIFKC